MNNIITELCSVSKSFQKGPETIRAVDNVSLKIQAGDFIAIQGSSGSGKSTLLHLIGALDRPTQGQILFAGIDIVHLSDAELSALRRRIGFVFQSFNLISDLTVLQNVSLPLKYANVKQNERDRYAQIALETVGMAHRLAHRPSELSGGEEQRVAIARAIISKPELILADEPTGNLDTHNREIVLSVLKELNSRGQTIVIVTHDQVVADASKERLLMQDGRLINREL